LLYTKQAENFKQTLSACKKADGNCFFAEEGSADGGFHAKRGHNNVRSVLRNTQRTAYPPFITKGMEC
jgi:hypothetical protein